MAHVHFQSQGCTCVPFIVLKTIFKQRLCWGGGFPLQGALMLKYKTHSVFAPVLKYNSYFERSVILYDFVHSLPKTACSLSPVPHLF